MSQETHANVAPDPTIYFPSNLMTPADPAPYWNIVTTPPHYQQSRCVMAVGRALPYMKPIIPPTAIKWCESSSENEEYPQLTATHEHAHLHYHRLAFEVARA
jgi:hypothetical protein